MDLDLTDAIWRKSTRSGSNGGQCVEVATMPGVVAVRDSKNPDGPALAFTRDGWQAFVSQVKAGEHDTA